MKYRTKTLAATFFAVCLVTVNVVLAADAASGAASATKAAAIGDAAPQWKELTGTDDKPHSSRELADAKAVVVVFTCNHCPVAVAYEDRLTQLAADYKSKGVAVVAINVSNLESDKLPAMKTRAEEKGFKFAYLYDPSQESARAFGAAVTPHAFLVDGDGKLVYSGAIDDNMSVDKVSQHYLRDAIDSVLAGGTPTTATTKPVGCGIGYEGS